MASAYFDPAVAEFYAGLAGDDSVFRPDRDVRLSKDTSPYQTDGSMWAGEVGGVYLPVDVHGVMVGGGVYEPSADQLRRARTAIDSAPPAAAGWRATEPLLAGVADDVGAAAQERPGPGRR